MKKQAIIYARSATDNPDSLSAQIAACGKWAETHDYRVVAEYKEVASGNRPRPSSVLTKVIAHAQKHGAILVVVEPSRLSRNLVTLVSIVSKCKRQGVYVQYVKH